VGAGLLSVLIFPMLARMIHRPEARRSTSRWRAPGRPEVRSGEGATRVPPGPAAAARSAAIAPSRPGGEAPRRDAGSPSHGTERARLRAGGLAARPHAGGDPPDPVWAFIAIAAVYLGSSRVSWLLTRKRQRRLRGVPRRAERLEEPGPPGGPVARLRLRRGRRFGLVAAGSSSTGGPSARWVWIIPRIMIVAIVAGRELRGALRRRIAVARAPAARTMMVGFAEEGMFAGSA